MLTRLAVDLDVAVVDELAGGEDRRDELGAVDDRVEAALQQADQVLAGVALHADGLGVGGAELLLGNVAVVALELLLGLQLGAEVRELRTCGAGRAGRGRTHGGSPGSSDDPRCSRPYGDRSCTWQSDASTSRVPYSFAFDRRRALLLPLAGYDRPAMKVDRGCANLPHRRVAIRQEAASLAAAPSNVNEAAGARRGFPAGRSAKKPRSGGKWRRRR